MSNIQKIQEKIEEIQVICIGEKVLRKQIEEKRMKEMRKIYEKLEEIQAICIGADSPDAIEHGERDPFEELQCCREDLGAISNIVEELQKLIKGE